MEDDIIRNVKVGHLAFIGNYILRMSDCLAAMNHYFDQYDMLGGMSVSFAKTKLIGYSKIYLD